MQKIFVAALLGLALFPYQPRAQQSPTSPLSQAQTTFAIDLYGSLSRTPGNLFFSPYSVATALEMVYLGAKGSTADEIARTLHLNLLGASHHLAAVQTALLSDEKQQELFPANDANGFIFHTANAIWGDNGFTFERAFVSRIKTNFGGDLEPVDFTQPDSASAQINQWVAAQTQGKIQNLVTPEMLTGDPAMVLTNAVYFKAAWAEEFDPTLTKLAAFHVSRVDKVPTEMMNMQDSFFLAQAGGVKVLAMPYRNYDASMLIILPDNPQGLPAVEAELSVTKLNGWLAAGKPVPVILSVPKFQTESEFQLKDILMRLGMKTSFNPKSADFTGIAADLSRRIYIGDVVHKSHITIDEKGTEAEAATAVLMAFAASAPMPEPPPPPPVPFIADHPFLYLICSNLTGDVLFMGRVDDPNPQGQ